MIQVAKEARIFDKHGLRRHRDFHLRQRARHSGDSRRRNSHRRRRRPRLASARLAGGDVVAIAGNVNVLPIILFRTRASKRPEDLKGKIGGNHIAGTTAEFALKVGLKKIGLDPLKDVTLRVIGGSIERMVALQKGIVQFTVVTEAGKAQAEDSAILPSLTWSACKSLFRKTAFTPQPN